MFVLGTGGLTANKGAVLIQLGLQSRDQIFVFVGVHLAPHDNAQDARLKQIARICEEFGSLLRKSRLGYFLILNGFFLNVCGIIKQ